MTGWRERFDSCIEGASLSKSIDIVFTHQTGDEVKIMKATIKVCSVSLALVLAGACPLALAQSVQKQENVKTSTFVMQTDDKNFTWSVPGPDTFMYVGSEMAFESGVVKGAPYSAQGTTSF